MKKLIALTLIALSMSLIADEPLMTNSAYINTFRTSPCLSWNFDGRCNFKDYMTYSVPEAHSLFRVINQLESRIIDLERRLEAMDNSNPE